MYRTGHWFNEVRFYLHLVYMDYILTLYTPSSLELQEGEGVGGKGERDRGI